jgi:hypothetical protein
MNNSSFEVSIKFEINEHKVSMSSGLDYEKSSGSSHRGFVFGNCVVEVLESLKPHFEGDEWKSFLLSLSQLKESENH